MDGVCRDKEKFEEMVRESHQQALTDRDKVYSLAKFRDVLDQMSVLPRMVVILPKGSLYLPPADDQRNHKLLAPSDRFSSPPSQRSPPQTRPKNSHPNLNHGLYNFNNFYFTSGL